MKQLKIILLASIFILALAGCGTKEKLKEKADEAITEEIIEDATGGDVDIDGDKITVKDESGATITIGTDWPTSELSKTIPEFKDGVITSVTDSEDIIIISMEQVKSEDYLDYLKEIKKDYSEDSYETSASDLSSYGASNGEGTMVQLYYEIETELMNITITREVK